MNSNPQISAIGRSFSDQYTTKRAGLTLEHIKKIDYCGLFCCNGQNGILSCPELIETGDSAFTAARFSKVYLPKLSSFSQALFSGGASGGGVKMDIYAPVLKKMQSNCFLNHWYITDLNLSGVTESGSGTFYNCQHLSSINLNSLTSIGNNSFYNCYSLQVLCCGQFTTEDIERNKRNWGLHETSDHQVSCYCKDGLCVLTELRPR